MFGMEQTNTSDHRVAHKQEEELGNMPLSPTVVCRLEVDLRNFLMLNTQNENSIFNLIPASL